VMVMHNKCGLHLIKKIKKYTFYSLTQYGGCHTIIKT
jgi:hypothetical protein